MYHYLLFWYATRLFFSSLLITINIYMKNNRPSQKFAVAKINRPMFYKHQTQNLNQNHTTDTKHKVVITNIQQRKRKIKTTAVHQSQNTQSTPTTSAVTTRTSGTTQSKSNRQYCHPLIYQVQLNRNLTDSTVTHSYTRYSTHN